MARDSRWADQPDSDHPVEWESADGKETAYLTWEGVFTRLVPNWYPDAGTVRLALEGGAVLRTTFAYYRLVKVPA